MIRSLKSLEDAIPPLSQKTDWMLHIVGSGPQEEALKSLTISLDLQKRVIFCGRVPDDELEVLYGDADLFLMPAVQGYGLPALEALARGVPVILHRDSGVSEILGGTPWVQIIEHQEDDLASAIEIMIGRFERDALHHRDRPNVPTEAIWAEELCRVCQWI